MRLTRRSWTLAALCLAACGASSPASAAIARLHAGQRPAASVEARELAKIGFALVPDGTPGSRPAARLRIALVPNDPAYQFLGFQWAFSLPGFTTAWDQTMGDPNTVIAIVDTGVDPATTDLQGALLPGYNFVDNNTDTSDVEGHGTAMAGLAAARTNNGQGVAGACGRCSILPVRIAQPDGSSNDATLSAGIVWAADHGARVISVSFGGGSVTPVLASAVAYAQAKGALVVAAAGNEGLAQPDYPAGYPGVISVEASDSNDQVYPWSNHGSGVTIAAPGCAPSLARQNLYYVTCGTSIATPLVAGAAALYASVYPNATALQIAAALESSATRATDSKYGRLDVVGLLGSAPPALPAPAPTPGAPAGPLPPGPAPVAIGPPTVVGAGVVGGTLSGNVGIWVGNAATFTYQWLRCTSAGCSEIAGATDLTYQTVPADAGHWLELRVTAWTQSGNAVAMSSATDVAAAPLPATKRAKAAPKAGHRR